MSRARQALSVLALVFAAVAFTTGVVYADDCSSPSDCSNTAWTVGGGAAAAAAIAAAAAAAGWLPGAPEPQGDGFNDPGCFDELQELLWPAHDMLNRITNLAGMKAGAMNMQRRAVEDWVTLSRQLQELTGASILPGVSTDAANLGGGLLDMPFGPLDEPARFAESAAITAEEAARTAEGLRRAATRFGELGLEAEARQAARQAASYGRLAELKGVPLRGISAGITVLDPLMSLAGRWAGMVQQGQQQEFGVLASQMDQKRSEARRWADYRRELDGRIEGLMARLNLQLQRYEAKAIECGAKPIAMPTFDELDTATKDAAAAHVDIRPGLPPRSVFDPNRPVSAQDRPERPEPLEEDDRNLNCDEAPYREDLQQFRLEEREWSDATQEYLKWRQRESDLDVSYHWYDIEFRRGRARFEYESSIWRGWSNVDIVSGTTAMIAFFASFELIAAAAGVYSLGATLKMAQHTPDEWNNTIAAWCGERLSWLQQRQAYTTSEIIRLSAILQRLERSLALRRQRMLYSYRWCDGQAKGWPQPPEMPDVASRHVRPDGSRRTMQEIGTWR